MDIMTCELCESRVATDLHHYLPGASRDIPVGEADGAGRIQKLIQLCRECHNDVHSLPAEKFITKHRKAKKKFIRINHNVEMSLIKNAGDIVYENHISDEYKKEVASA